MFLFIFLFIYSICNKLHHTNAPVASYVPLGGSDPRDDHN